MCLWLGPTKLPAKDPKAMATQNVDNFARESKRCAPCPRMFKFARRVQKATKGILSGRRDTPDLLARGVSRP